MKKFKQYITEAGGAAPGKLELVSTDVDKAYAFAQKTYPNIDAEVPEFKKNYEIAKGKAALGKTQRKDMPVIDTSDVKQLQYRLKNGKIDINPPYGDAIPNSNPFPEGLSGEEAKKWLEGGLRIYDGNKRDDKIKVGIEKVAVGDLKPIQKQIYADKSINMFSGKERSVAGTKSFLTKKSIFIGSSDNYIIDGHHRFLAGVLIDPSMKVQVLKIDLPIKKLLPMTLAYGDAIGNKRNL